MYYEQFDSYQTSMGNCKAFRIEVDCVDGTTVASSPIPIEAYSMVMEDIMDTESGAPLRLWSSSTHTINAVLHHNIVNIRTVLL